MVDEWYFNGMRTTIDKAGRLVIPAAVRDRAGLTPGTTIEISIDDTGVRLERVADGPCLERVGKRLVARPTVGLHERPSVDVAALIDEERRRWP
jgi:AbrB family looped-hinge helix DNA binding protein